VGRNDVFLGFYFALGTGGVVANDDQLLFANVSRLSGVILGLFGILVVRILA
jgi:membrane associated rhomboid family serine protease